MSELSRQFQMQIFHKIHSHPPSRTHTHSALFRLFPTHPKRGGGGGGGGLCERKPTCINAFVTESIVHFLFVCRTAEKKREKRKKRTNRYLNNKRDEGLREGQRVLDTIGIKL